MGSFSIKMASYVSYVKRLFYFIKACILKSKHRLLFFRSISVHLVFLCIKKKKRSIQTIFLYFFMYLSELKNHWKINYSNSSISALYGQDDISDCNIFSVWVCLSWSPPENISWDMHHLLMKALHCSHAVRQQFCYTIHFLQ